MKLFATLFLALGAFQSASANEDLVDGMKGLHEAAKDPRLLAKLMEDLNVSNLNRFVLHSHGNAHCHILSFPYRTPK